MAVDQIERLQVMVELVEMVRSHGLDSVEGEIRSQLDALLLAYKEQPLLGRLSSAEHLAEALRLELAMASVYVEDSPAYSFLIDYRDRAEGIERRVKDMREELDHRISEQNAALEEQRDRATTAIDS